MDGLPGFAIDPQDPLRAWFAWGDHLRKEYAIEQYAFMRWDDDSRALIFRVSKGALVRLINRKPDERHRTLSDM